MQGHVQSDTELDFKVPFLIQMKEDEGKGSKYLKQFGKL